MPHLPLQDTGWLGGGGGGGGASIYLTAAGAALDAMANDYMAGVMAGLSSGSSNGGSDSGIAELPLSVDPSLLSIVPGTLPGDSSGSGAANIQVDFSFDASSGAWSPDQGLATAVAAAGLGAGLWSAAPSVQSGVTWTLWDSPGLFQLWNGTASDSWTNGLSFYYSNWVGIDPLDAPSWLDVSMGAGGVAGAAFEAATAVALTIADWYLFNVAVDAYSEFYENLFPTTYDSPPLLGAPFSDSGVTSGG